MLTFCVDTRGVCGRVERGALVHIGDRHLRIGHRGTARVRYRANNAAKYLLRLKRDRAQLKSTNRKERIETRSLPAQHGLPPKATVFNVTRPTKAKSALTSTHTIGLSIHDFQPFVSPENPSLDGVRLIGPIAMSGISGFYENLGHWTNASRHYTFDDAR